MPKKKYSKKYFLCVTAIIVLLLVSITAGVNILNGFRTVVIYADGRVTEIRTKETKVEDILLQAEVEFREFDYISIGLNEEITEEYNNIHIKRSVPIKVIANNNIFEYETVSETVGFALSEIGIEVSKLDKIQNNITNIEISKDEPIKENMEIRFIDIAERVISEEIVLPYDSVEIRNDDLENGKTMIVQEGQPGKRITTYNTCYTDGVETSKQKLSETVITEPVNEVREVGTLSTFTTSRGIGIGYNNSFVLNATAYTAASVKGKSPSHPTYGITATGMRAKVGVVAVDRKVIPLGTKLYVESLDSTKDYGYCIAVDTGVYGNKIDLYFDTISECYQFGRRNVKVYVLKDQSIDVFSARE